MFSIHASVLSNGHLGQYNSQTWNEFSTCMDVVSHSLGMLPFLYSRSFPSKKNQTKISHRKAELFGEIQTSHAPQLKRTKVYWIHNVWLFLLLPTAAWYEQDSLKRMNAGKKSFLSLVPTSHVLWIKGVICTFTFKLPSCELLLLLVGRAESSCSVCYKFGSYA